MKAERTYLDHNATAPLRPEARAQMIAALDLAGNASSVHEDGRRARMAIETAREHVATLVGAEPEQVVFTSGATEANNWVMRGGWDGIAAASIEHDSVLAPALASGAPVTRLPCDTTGRVLFDGIAEALASRSLASRSLVSVGLANSETGVLQTVAALAGGLRAAGARAVVHTDAVQAVGRIPVDLDALGADLVSVSAHKIGGPKGAGALVIRHGLELPPFMQGGGQERRRRAGTENIAAIAGFGAAAKAARRDIGEMERVRALRERIEQGVREATPDAVIVGAVSQRLANTSCIALSGDTASTLLIKLDLLGIAVSAGSACSSGRIGGSHVLAAMGLAPALAAAAIRVSLGPTSTEADADRFLAAWAAIHAGRARRPAMSQVSASALARAATELRAGE